MHLRNSFVLRSAIAATLFATLSAAAAAADTSDYPEDLEEVIVTGSYIEGAVENAALPVTVLDRDDLERQGSPAVLDVIRSLSASQGTVGEGNPGMVLFGTGAVGVNLRGLEGGRTLVLFNGRRLPVSPVALLGVDVNLLPLGAVDKNRSAEGRCGGNLRLRRDRRRRQLHLQARLRGPVDRRLLHVDRGQRWRLRDRI